MLVTLLSMLGLAFLIGDLGAETDADDGSSADAASSQTDETIDLSQNSSVDLLDMALEGTDKNELIVGTEEADTVFAAAGDDSVIGNAGDDSLFGDDDDDALIGLDGNDKIRGGSGFDFLAGGAGEDTLFGDNDSDLLMGADVILSSEMTNTLMQGLPPESILFEFDPFEEMEEADSLSGGAGADVLFLGGSDTASTGVGADDVVIGDWIEDGSVATVADFDTTRDVLVYFFETNEPVVTVEEDEDGNANVLFDGDVKAVLQDVYAPDYDPNDVILVATA